MDKEEEFEKLKSELEAAKAAYAAGDNLAFIRLGVVIKRIREAGYDVGVAVEPDKPESGEAVESEISQ